MADTYEKTDYTAALETFEWDHVWIEHTENRTAKRVLYIGDSISCGTHPKATEAADGEILFDNFGTSKALDNPFYTRALLCFMEQLPSCDAVLFNNGYHGWHLDDAAYEAGFRKMLDFLKAHMNVLIYLVNSTCPMNDPETRDRIERRNAVVDKLAAEYALPVIDLFSVSVEYMQLHLGDGVHFSGEGYKRLGECIVNSIKFTQMS